MNNEYGLDARYFKEQLGIIVRDAKHYRPDEMARALRRLADVAEPQWISVKDRLPEEGQHIVCCRRFPGDPSGVVWWFGCCEYPGDKFPWVTFDDPSPVQYWQPLPPPPE